MRVTLSPYGPRNFLLSFTFRLLATPSSGNLFFRFCSLQSVQPLPSVSIRRLQLRSVYHLHNLYSWNRFSCESGHLHYTGYRLDRFDLFEKLF